MTALWTVRGSTRGSTSPWPTCPTATAKWFLASNRTRSGPELRSSLRSIGHRPWAWKANSLQTVLNASKGGVHWSFCLSDTHKPEKCQFHLDDTHQIKKCHISIYHGHIHNPLCFKWKRPHGECLGIQSFVVTIRTSLSSMCLNKHGIYNFRAVAGTKSARTGGARGVIIRMA